MNTVKWILRLGIFATFLGHGMFAFYVKSSWIVYLTSLGFSENQAIQLMPFIGILDFVVALFALLKPLRIVLIWAFLWAFLTALVRPLAGESIWDFVERGANWATPLALLFLQGLPKRFKDLWKEE